MVNLSPPNNNKIICEHDFLAILHCKKCGEQFHTHWPDALVEAKLEAVVEVLRRTKATINVKKASPSAKKEAVKLIEKSFQEVKEVFEATVKEHHAHYRKRVATIR